MSGIVHSHELFHSGIVVMIAKLAGVNKCFVHAHNCAEGNTNHDKKSIIRRTYNGIMRAAIRRYASDFCACSSLAGQYLFGKDVLQHPKYHLVVNSVNTGKYLRDYNKEVNGEFTNDGWINIIQVGRYTEVKNQLYSVEVAKVFQHNNLKIRILCAGDFDNEYGNKVKEAVVRNGLGDYFVMLGIRKDIDELLRKASVFFMPSQYEGMPLALIEAQATGIPCVVADTFSHEVDFGIGYVKWVSISENSECWADYIIAASRKKRADYDLVKKIIDNKGFDSKAFADKLCELYKGALSD